MALAPAITDLEQLKDRPALAKLLSWKADAVTGAKFDRGELTIWLRRESLRDACAMLRDDPGVDSLTDLWPGANPFEREIFDLFGVRFYGHPYLRRIMMPEDWEGHPLRKDYPVEGYR